MNTLDRHNHWEKIYNTKQPNEFSWYQSTPSTSLEFISRLNIPTTAKIIDIGGGDSFLVDSLLDMGYNDVTVLDISETSLEKTKARLGDRANKIKWIAADACSFRPTEKYDLWHDRACFHFLTDEKEIEKYIDIAQQSINPKGALVIGAFSEQGPKKCSGLEIKQYSEAALNNRLEKFFNKVKCVTVDHKTPFGTAQNFIFCCFEKL